MRFKKGDVVRLPTKDQLFDKGWRNDSLGRLKHPTQYNYSLDARMQLMLGRSYTVLTGNRFNNGSCGWLSLYTLKEDLHDYNWCLDDMIDDMAGNSDHEHVEGMTPVGGHFICKICGDNMREVK